ncbi:hypothetical protein SKAU_G00230200 [Synaphobranchus kaupii]|uniref:Neurexin/syndecan/glycophorin C domain-containing protein n=1 Tax=Synaphobranchus kaupii TaxID=118154 RepID=A0A9Q1F5I3_SYNKA|nr:hypothetical protein SKAU_G00230200 [Synaphobranchus kaupii]
MTPHNTSVYKVDLTFIFLETADRLWLRGNLLLHGVQKTLSLPRTPKQPIAMDQDSTLMDNSTRHEESATQAVITSNNVNDQSYEAVLGGVIAAVILVLLCLVATVLRYMYRHKGTYHTNEAKGTEFAETADAALKNDPSLQDAMDENKKEYFI